MNPLIQKLEAAVFSRNPGLAQLLQPGLKLAQIQKTLKRGGIEGVVEPIIDLYSWRNGTQFLDDAAHKGGIVPPRTIPMTEPEKEFMRAIGVKRDTHPEHYHLLDLKRAVSVARGGAMEGYFPFLLDTGRGSAYLAIDLEPSGKNAVVKIETMETRDKYPVREAYSSFEDFLTDAILCNQNGQPLACLCSETKPIIHVPAAKGPVSADATGKKILTGENPLALRTDFSDEDAWKSLCAAIQNLDSEFGASVDYVSDPKYDGLKASQLPSLLSEDSPASFAFIIDRLALSHPDHPVLVIDLHDKIGRTFRVIPSELGSVENNLSTANMGFDEFAKTVDKEGIFRGFK